ncbi:hypothetical protein N7X57_05420 [Lactiplantibacillus paraplantarum]|uniref:DUF6932 family protein n=1 Tax=Lactiplantibacillus paraplantarum TaxID=60520 RepID=UPI002221E77D|nr:hypothetical protein [Lactiplantibacillus paraplantarum]MCW1909884.1 hypothetical protein [Lactiplantibacillus paraplantarum]
MIEFNENGVINDDKSEKITLAEFRSCCIDNNVDQEQRNLMFDQFISLWESSKLEDVRPFITSIWIDGSFTEKKHDPDDIDIVILVSPSPEKAVDLKESIEILTDDRDKIKEITKTHLLCAFDVPNIDFSKYDNQFKEQKNIMSELYYYFQALFSKNRETINKSLIVLEVKGGKLL